MFQVPHPRPCSDNLRRYVSLAVLQPMIPGPGAPMLPPAGHKAHRNHIAVRQERYRQRFAKIVSAQASGVFDAAVLEFIEKFPSTPLNQPNHDNETGNVFTVSAPGFNIGQAQLPRPSTVQEVSLWITAIPLQTMTRTLQIIFPECRGWDVTFADTEDTERSLWNTLVWRKVPPPPDPEEPWLHKFNPLETCSVVFVVQPPWIMSPQDFKSFIRCKSLPAPKARGPGRPYTGAQRVWAKLWDTCVRRKCNRWVVSSYGDWVFGAFTEGFTAGRILDHKTQDACAPTIVECLVYHVASSMGLVQDARLPQYHERSDDLNWVKEIPPPSRILGVEFPDSGSEWDGMDDEPGISAGVSTMGSITLSAWGSEDGTPSTYDMLRQQPTLSLVTKVEMWGEDVADPPPFEREPTPTPSEAGHSHVGIYAVASHSSNVLPTIKMVQRSGLRPVGGFLTTVMEQGPVEEES